MVSIESCDGGSGLRCFGEVAILSDILSRLPIKSLMRFKLVCTDWQLLIEKDSNFINLQLTRSESDVNRTSLLVFPLHEAGCVGEETRIMLFTGEEEEENISSSGEVVVPCDLLLSCRSIIDTDFSIPIGVQMLKSINGLVCFYFSWSVLIYNPSTRQRTCWINTNIEIEKVEFLRESNVAECDTNQCELWSRSYGFGFDPITKDHKVVCVYEITICRSSANVFTSGKNKIIFEVLKIGENRWRKIDEVLPSRVGSSVYANGYIYGMGYKKRFYSQSDVILGFNVGSEKFDRVIKTPNFMLDLWCSMKNKRVSTTVVF
ncbi:hypothetical protein MKX01_000989 [Papaver californicum]|nr:hypothetical protein MKX01_000989 [Papaver californicum]